MSGLPCWCLRRSVSLDVQLLQDARCLSAVTGSLSHKPRSVLANTSFVDSVKPHSRIAQAATVVSAKRWSGDNKRGVVIHNMNQLIDLYETMSAEELLSACTALNSARGTREAGLPAPAAQDAMSDACAPLKEYVLRECTGKLITVIGSLSASMAHWMPGFASDTLPMVCGRLADRLHQLSTPQLIALVEVLPHSLPISARLCNEAAKILQPRAQLLLPAQMVSCVFSLGRGGDPVVFQLLQHCVDELTTAHLEKLTLYSLLRCTQVAFCRQLDLAPFVARLTDVLARRQGLESVYMALHVACYQLAVNGHVLPPQLLDRYCAVLPPDLVQQSKAARLVQVLLVLGSAPASEQRLMLEHMVGMALLGRLEDVPAEHGVTLLKVAKRSLCRSPALPELVFAICSEPAQSSMPFEDIHFVLSSAATLKLLDYRAVRDWAFAVLSTKIQCLTAAEIPDVLRCLLVLPGKEAGGEHLKRLVALVDALFAFTVAQPESLFSMAELRDYMTVVTKSGFSPSVGQLRALFLPRMSSCSPVDLVSCLRSIHDSLGQSQPELVGLAIASQEKPVLAELENADLVWMVKFLEGAPVHAMNVGRGHRFLLEVLEERVDAGLLCADELSELGGVRQLHGLGEGLLQRVTAKLHGQLASLTGRQLGKLNHMVTAMLAPDASVREQVQEAFRKELTVNKLSELKLLIPLCEAHGRKHQAAVDRLLLDIANGELAESSTLSDYADVLPLLYRHGVLGKGVYYGKRLGEELKKRYANMPCTSLPGDFWWLAYCVSMVGPAPATLLTRCFPAAVPHFSAMDTVYALSCFASVGRVPEDVRPLLATQLLAVWASVPKELTGVRSRSLTKLDFLESVEVAQLSTAQVVAFDPRAADILKAMRCQQPSLLVTALAGLRAGMPDTAITWCRTMHTVLLHCAAVEYSDDAWQEVKQLAQTDINFDKLRTLVLCTAEWMQMCQTGVMEMTDACWDLLQKAGPGNLSFDLGTGNTFAQECAELSMLLNGVGHLQFQKDRLHADSVLLLGRTNRRNASEAYAANYSHCADHPDAELRPRWSLRSHVADWLTGAQSAPPGRAGLLLLSAASAADHRRIHLGRDTDARLTSAHAEGAGAGAQHPNDPHSTEHAVPEGSTASAPPPHEHIGREKARATFAEASSAESTTDGTDVIRTDETSSHRALVPESGITSAGEATSNVSTGGDCNCRWPLPASSSATNGGGTSTQGHTDTSPVLHASTCGAAREHPQAPHSSLRPQSLDTRLLSHLGDHPDPAQFVHGPVVDEHSGILIDAAMALDRHGALLPFGAKLSSDRGLLPWGPPEWPADARQRVALVTLRPEHYVRFSRRLRRDVMAKFRLLEGFGWTVHMVNSCGLEGDAPKHFLKSIFKQIDLQKCHSLLEETVV